MQTDTEEMPGTPENEMPSADFVRAVSDLLDTDPDDLLAELGYYERTEQSPDRA